MNSRSPLGQEEVELRNAAMAMRDDLIDRAKFGFKDATPIVACGNSVWMRFCEAIHAHIAANAQVREADGSPE